MRQKGGGERRRRNRNSRGRTHNAAAQLAQLAKSEVRWLD